MQSKAKVKRIFRRSSGIRKILTKVEKKGIFLIRPIKGT